MDYDYDSNSNNGNNNSVNNYFSKIRLSDNVVKTSFDHAFTDIVKTPIHIVEQSKNVTDEQKEDDIKTFFDKPGKQHYRFLSYLSTLFNNSILIDIGTHRGHSALALSYNESNTVYSFDIEDRIYNEKIKNKENIKFCIDNIFGEKEGKWDSLLRSSAFIFLDIDPHEGSMELEFFNYLKNIQYGGFIVCDDVWFFKSMRDNFWYKIKESHRFDFSFVGHWSGTGIVAASEEGISLIQNKFGNVKTDLSNWTLVTAYYDLTKFEDATDEIKKRDTNYFKEHCISTLNLPYNLVIFCEKESYPFISQLRESAGMKEKTQYVIRDFDELKINKEWKKKFSDYREQIIENRRTHPYYFDPRNNASYYLFCISRYISLKETVESNPFNSTHFGWINFCIERMGHSNLIHLEEALAEKRDKISTCYIDYIEPKLVFNTQEYFQFGRCSMCSGFFTGNGYYMSIFCDLILNKFLKYLKEGYGHSDETLYSPVFFQNAELFQHYYGDYQQMITNYKYVYENPHSIIYNFIRHSFENDDFEKCFEACEFLWSSIEKGKCELGENFLDFLMFYMNESRLKKRKQNQGYFLEHMYIKYSI